MAIKVTSDSVTIVDEKNGTTLTFNTDSESDTDAIEVLSSGPDQSELRQTFVDRGEVSELMDALEDWFNYGYFAENEIETVED